MANAALTAALTQSLVSTFNVAQPAKRNQLFRAKGDQGITYYNTLDTLGYTEAVKNGTYSHFEEDWVIYPLVQNNAPGQSGAGNDQEFEAKPSYSGNGTHYLYARQGDLVMYPTGETAYIKTVALNGAVFDVTVSPVRAGVDLPDGVDGAALAVYSNTFGERTGQPEGRIGRVTEETFNTKIIKDTMTVSGSEMTNELWYKVRDGQNVAATYLKGQLDTDLRIKASIDGALLFDEPTNNSLVDSDGNEIQTTTGLRHFIEAGGNVSQYTKGTWTMPMMDVMVKELDKNNAPMEFLALCGIDLYLDLENLNSDFMQNNPIVFAAGEAPMNELHLGLKCFTKGDRKFYLQKLGQLNHPNVYGGPNFKIPGMGFVCPLGKKASNKGEDIPYIGMRYKAMGGYSRLMEIWPTGGAGNQTKTSDVDEYQLNMRCEIGAEYIAANHFYLWKQS